MFEEACAKAAEAENLANVEPIRANASQINLRTPKVIEDFGHDDEEESNDNEDSRGPFGSMEHVEFVAPNRSDLKIKDFSNDEPASNVIANPKH